MICIHIPFTLRASGLEVILPAERVCRFASLEVP